MRPLIRDSSFNFGINGQTTFHNGESENPEIGTIEDWYFINTMTDPKISHPLHVHLIQYEHIREYELKFVPGRKCTFYQVDFYMRSLTTSCPDSTKPKGFQAAQMKAKFLDNCIRDPKCSGSTCCATTADYQDACDYLNMVNNKKQINST